MRKCRWAWGFHLACIRSPWHSTSVWLRRNLGFLLHTATPRSTCSPQEAHTFRQYFWRFSQKCAPSGPPCTSSGLSLSPSLTVLCATTTLLMAAPSQGRVSAFGRRSFAKAFWTPPSLDLLQTKTWAMLSRVCEYYLTQLGWTFLVFPVIFVSVDDFQREVGGSKLSFPCASTGTVISFPLLTPRDFFWGRGLVFLIWGLSTIANKL